MMNKFTLTLLCVALTASAADAPALRSHAEILRRMPLNLVNRLGAVPDTNGLVGGNREGFKASALQRGATVRLAIAAARGEVKDADDSWRAVDAAFAHQTAEGDFGDPATSVAFWLCELSRSLLVVQESPLSAHFHDRIATLKPKMAKAAHWLAAHHEQLQREDAATPNRLFFDAEAFLFTGVLLGDDALQKLGHEFVAQGIKLYRSEDGVFLEHKGADTSYQAVNLLRLQEIVLRFPDAQAEAAIAKGVQWELSRIASTGEVSTEGNTRVFPGGEKFLGREKQVNYGEISLALLLYHGRTSDPAALAAVERLQSYVASQKGQQKR